MTQSDGGDTVCRFMQKCREEPDFFFQKVLGIKAWHKQREIAESVRDNRYTCVASGHNVGKALCLETKVPTPTGYRRLGDVELGDQLIAPSGKPCNVTFVTPTMTDLKCFKIDFGYGLTVDACEDHQWVAHLTKRSGMKRIPLWDATPKTYTTREIAEHLAKSGSVAYLPMAKAADLPERDLPVDPYVLGVWLGDGTRNTGQVGCQDHDVWDQIEKRGYRLGPLGKRGLSRTVYGLVTKLREIGALTKERIPGDYLFASIEQRRDLLRGLLDTDGSCNRNNGAIVFVQTRKWIADLVAELASSLGHKVSKVSVRKSKHGHKDAYTVRFYADEPLFYIQRKASRQNVRKRSPGRRDWRKIEKITPIESKPMRCLTVDAPEHEFLITDRWIRTHNTFITACICLWFIATHPQSVVLTTANSWLQVKEVLWKEIRRLHGDAIMPIGGTFKPKQPELVYARSKMIGFSPASPDAVNGHHEENILIVFDEAQGLQEFETWDAFSSMMSSGNAKQLAIGNPLYAYGPYYKKFKDPKWNSIQISCLDHPNVTNRDLIIKGAVTHDFVEELAQDPVRGKGSLYWDTRIAGIFPKISADVYMPQNFVQRCINLHTRDNGAPAQNFKPLPGFWAGVDVAGKGDDKTVVAILEQGILTRYEALPRLSIKEQVLLLMTLTRSHGVPDQHVNYDPHGGVGAEFGRWCLEFEYAATPVGLSPDPIGDWGFFFGFAHQAPFHFKNRRTELHWTLRKCFEECRLSLTEKMAERFAIEACELKFGHWNEDGALYIESKEKYIKRVGHSPDFNDALVLAMNRNIKATSLHIAAARRSNAKAFNPKTVPTPDAPDDWR